VVSLIISLILERHILLKHGIVMLPIQVINTHMIKRHEMFLNDFEQDMKMLLLKEEVSKKDLTKH